MDWELIGISLAGGFGGLAIGWALTTFNRFTTSQRFYRWVYRRLNGDDPSES